MYKITKYIKDVKIDFKAFKYLSNIILYLKAKTE